MAMLRPAPEMKESGIEWMGVIPKDWNTIRFKFVHIGANVGMSIDREYWSDDESDTAFYTAQINPIHVRYEGFPEWKYTSEKDLLLARNATPYVYLPVSKAAYTDHIIRVEIKPNFDRRYVRYCLQHSITYDVADGVSLPTWSVSIWNRQVIPSLPFEKQQAIASYLDDRCSKLDEIIAEYGDAELEDLDLGNFFNALVSMARKNGIELPGTVTMLARSLVTLEGVVDEFLPGVSIVDIIRQHVRSTIQVDEQVKREAKRYVRESYEASHALLRAARDLPTLSRMLTRGQIRTQLDLTGINDAMRGLSSSADRLSMSIVVAGLFIGSSVVYYARIKPVIFGVPVIGFVGYFLALILGLWIVGSILRKDRKHRRH